MTDSTLTASDRILKIAQQSQILAICCTRSASQAVPRRDEKQNLNVWGVLGAYFISLGESFSSIKISFLRMLQLGAVFGPSIPFLKPDNQKQFCFTLDWYGSRAYLDSNTG